MRLSACYVCLALVPLIASLSATGDAKMALGGVSPQSMAMDAGAQGHALRGKRTGREVDGSVGHMWGETGQSAARGVGGAGDAQGNLKLRGGLGYLSHMMVLPGQMSRGPKMSKVEADGVKEVRRQLQADLRKVARSNPEMSSDDRILRFLRSYKHDVERTVERMRDMLDWRWKQGTDQIRELVVKHWHEDFWQMRCIPRRDFFKKMYLIEPNYAVDNTGDLVSVECTGMIDIRAFMHGVTEHEIIRFWCFLMEWNMIKLAQLTRKHGRLARMVQIKDMDGLSLWQSTCKVGMQRFGKINWMLHLVYPETLSRIIVTNIPGVFGGIWNIFKPLLPERTVKKIQIWPGKKEVQEGLSELVGESDLLTMQASGLFLFSDALAKSARRKRIIRQATAGVFGLGLIFTVGTNILASQPPSMRLEADAQRKR